MKKLLLFLFIAPFFGCNSNDDSIKNYLKENNYTPSPAVQTPIIEKDAYELMEVAFEGYPSKSDVQPMLEDVMKRYDMEVNNENLTKAANVLVTMKNDSKVGVTEMEILKRVYQKGNNYEDYVTNVARAAVFLEITK